MNVFLPSELDQFVESKLKSGSYYAASEVICEALWLLRDYDELQRIKLERLRKEIAIGVEQAERGDLVPLDMAKIKRNARKRLVRRKAK
jgi:antitoxin ParD1/3/4